MASLELHADPGHRRVTLADLRQLGREDGDQVASVYEGLTAQHGNSIPTNVLEVFLDWQHTQVTECLHRLRAAGLNSREIKEWYRGVKEKTKERGVASISAMKTRH